MLLETVTVFSGVGAFGTPVGVDVGVGLEVTVQHGFVDTGVVTLVALEGLTAGVAAHMIFQVMLVLGDECTLAAGEKSIGSNVFSLVIIKSILARSFKWTLFALLLTLLVLCVSGPRARRLG